MSYEYLRLLTSARLVVVYVPLKSLFTDDADENEVKFETVSNFDNYYRRASDLEDVVRTLSKHGVEDIEVLTLSNFLAQLDEDQFFIGGGCVRIIELGQEVRHTYTARSYDRGGVVVTDELN